MVSGLADCYSITARHPIQVFNHEHFELALVGRPQGPQVLPGKYTVRLPAGGQTLTRELEVRLDPTIPTPEPELRTQLGINLKLRDMQSSVNDALRSIDTFKSELETSEKTVRTLDPQAAKVLSAL